MAKETYMSLQHSESVVANMAATLFAAYIQRKEVTDENEDIYIKKAVHAAIRMATYADKIIKSDEEWMEKEEKLTPTRI